MPIIKNKTKINKVPLRIRMDENIHNEIQRYIEWADIKNKDVFFEEVCQYVFAQDKEWNEFKGINYKNGFQVEDNAFDIENKMVADDDGMPNLSDTENLGEKLKKKNT